MHGLLKLQPSSDGTKRTSATSLYFSMILSSANAEVCIESRTHKTLVNIFLESFIVLVLISPPNGAAPDLPGAFCPVMVVARVRAQFIMVCKVELALLRHTQHMRPEVI